MTTSGQGHGMTSRINIQVMVKVIMTSFMQGDCTDVRLFKFKIVRMDS